MLSRGCSIWLCVSATKHKYNQLNNHVDAHSSLQHQVNTYNYMAKYYWWCLCPGTRQVLPHLQRCQRDVTAASSELLCRGQHTLPLFWGEVFLLFPHHLLAALGPHAAAAAAASTPLMYSCKCTCAMLWCKFLNINNNVIFIHILYYMNILLIYQTQVLWNVLKTLKYYSINKKSSHILFKSQ